MSAQVFAQTGRVARSSENRVASARPAYLGLNNVSRLPNGLVAQRASRLVNAFRANVSKGQSTASRMVTQASLNLVFVSAEVAPWSKTGGLGDVVGGLPEELAKRGHNVLTIAPRYDQYHDAWDTSVVINVLGEPVRFFHIVKNGVHRVFVDHPWFLAKVWGKTGSKLYGPRSGMDFADNQKRFRLFCEAAIEATKVLPFAGGENSHFIANDWHAALVPVLLKYVYKPRGEFVNSKVAFCVHNIAFQGRFWKNSFGELNLPADSLKNFEFTDGYSKVFDELSPAKEDEDPKQEATGERYEKVNWMKAGFLTADKGLTVSPNYAKEIAADASKGVELDDIIRAIGGVEGIVNGMDIREWNPQTDKYLDVKYDKVTVNEGKAAAKSALQAEAGLPVDPSVPVFGFIGRLEEQKGVDILLAALPKIAAAGKAQIVILGTGKRKFETAVKKLETSFPGVAKGVVKFSPSLAHLITAGADYMVVPSRFEPCGLIQLHAMHYGTIPLVSSTGGLVDTVKEGKTGFQMGVMDPDDLLSEDADAVATTMQRAIDAYDTPLFYDMRYNAISQDLSWKKPAQKWEAIMEELVYGAPAGAEKKASVAVPVALVA